jgi:cobalt-zinc-cadmium efflux system membrane fusion protein
MRTSLRKALVSGLLAASTLLGPSACNRDSSSLSAKDAEAVGSANAEGHVELSPKALAAIGLETIVAQKRALSDEIRATAVIKPNEYRMAHVSPRIPGKAIRVQALLGNVVAAGDILAELDSIALGEKKAAFLQARADLEVSRRNYQREKRLFERHISSEKEYLETKGAFERSEAAYRASREALRLVGLSDDEIKSVSWSSGDHPLSHFPLLAPFGGTVVEQHITIGELIEPDETPYTIADLSNVWVLLDIYEKDLARVHVGDDAGVSVEAYPGETFRGKVTYLSSLLDPATRTAQARVEIDNGDGRLRPGMFATSTLSGETGPAVEQLVIPRDAVQQVHGKPVAFVEVQPGSYAMRELSLGRQAGPDVAVLAGVRAGERVVTEGAFYLKSIVLKEEVGEAD